MNFVPIPSGGLMYWTEKKDDKYKDNSWSRPYYTPRSADIEITAYALLSFTLVHDVSTSLTISRWLAEQRNSMGGYSSTQVNIELFAPVITCAYYVIYMEIDLRKWSKGSICIDA